MSCANSETNGLFEVQLDPNIALGSDCAIAINLITGASHNISGDEQARLRDISRGPQVISPVDLGLLDSGLLTFKDRAALARNSIQETITSYLGSHGALAIMPTEKCNFRCTYCYEKFEKGRMADWVISAAEGYLRASLPNHKSFALSWFGGEPLLQKKIVWRISEVFRQETKRTGVAGSVSITSNGYLIDREVISMFRDLEFDMVQISLDGPKPIHDRNRPHVRKSISTYQKVMEGIDRILEETTTTVIIRVNAHLGTPEDFDRVYQWLDEEIIPKYKPTGQRVRFHVVPIWSATTTKVSGICLSELSALQTVLQVKKLMADHEGKSVAQHLAGELSGVGTLSCYAGKPNHYVLGSDGAVYKCTVAFDLDVNKVGKLLPGGRLELDSAKDAAWTSASALTDKTCQQCSFAISCMGLHCPLTRMIEKRQPCPTDKSLMYSHLTLGDPEDA